MTNTQTQPTPPISNAVAPAPVSWFEIHSADSGRAKRFYAEVFGWRFDDSMPGCTMVDFGDGAPIGGGVVGTDGAYPDHALVMVQVPDVAAALDSARSHGGSIIAESTTAPNGLTFGYAANPDGSVFGVWCPPAD